MGDWFQLAEPASVLAVSHLSTAHMSFEVVPHLSRGCVYLESEPEGRAGRGRVALLRPAPGQPPRSPCAMNVPVSSPRLLCSEWGQPHEEKCLFPKEGEKGGRRPPSFCLA